MPLDYSLHFAAQKENLEEIQYLIEKKGLNVNQEDTRSTRPLHVAALFGNNEALKLLLSYGAEVEDEGYFGQTALDLAIQNKHYEVARTLVVQGKANPHHEIGKGKTAFTSTLKQLGEILISPCESPSTHSKKISEIYANDQDVLYPLALALKSYSSFLPDTYSQEKLLLLKEKIEAYDHPLDARFTQAKNLFLAFPIEQKEYTLTIDATRSMSFYPNGYFKTSATELTKESLNAYNHNLKKTETDLIKISLFSKLTTIYENASRFAFEAGDIKTAQTALDLYHTNETILLPTGWNGHAVNVILSKQQGYYVTANSGERYPNDPSGNIFHPIQNPDKIDLKFFQDTLLNQEQIKLEYERLYEYGLAEEILLIKAPEQKFGNCTWTSHLNSIESILYIELLNHGFTSKEALSRSHTYYEEWKHFHASYVIDQYLSDPSPGLSINAFTDIIQELHTEPSTKENNEYIQKFNEIVNSHSDFKSTLSILWSWLSPLSWWKWFQDPGSQTIEIENIATAYETALPIKPIDLQVPLLTEYF